ncbi:MAG: DUF4390 domain-containing protein [Methylophilaceae bacterium]
MHCCKKISFFCVLVFASLLAFAEQSTIIIRNADLKADGEVYKLNADLEFALSENIKEAINKGVLVAFVYEFKLVSPRLLWFDKEIVTKTTSIEVSYHALSRQYLVSQGGRQTSYEILSEAMIELVQLYDWKVFDQPVIESGEEYVATLNVKLDQSKLPKAIQVEAIGSEDWNLGAEDFEWLPKDLKQ